MFDRTLGASYPAALPCAPTTDPGDTVTSMTITCTRPARARAARAAAPIGAATALLTTLSGCSTAAAEAEIPVDASYRDGTYQASGAYVSPNGNESIIVTIELTDDVVTDVEITTNPKNPTTARYQSEFASGIAALVVGQDIDQLDVTVVAGSSLTGNGFREAIAAIRADAIES